MKLHNLIFHFFLTTSLLMTQTIYSPMAYAQLANNETELLEDNNNGNDAVEKRLQRLDSNDDGKISIDELQKVQTDRFNKMDVNHDGIISNVEFSEYHQQLQSKVVQHQFLRFDKNSDGKLDNGEYQAVSQMGKGRAIQHNLPAFAQADSDRDNAISLTEWQVLRPQKTRTAVFQKLDSNKDGKIGQDEFWQSRQEWFKKMDSNSDNFLTVKELAAKMPKNTLE